VLSKVLDKLTTLFDHPVSWAEIVFSQLHLPWDIHCDYARNNSSKTPSFNLLIPLHDVDSRTILFNETTTDYNDFCKYKQVNTKAPCPVPKEI
jgi:hypothetical protein